jgi:cobalt/nickel transport system permease protein
MGISQIPLSFIVGRAIVLFPFVLLAGVSIPWKDGSAWSGLATLFMRSFLSLLLLILLTNTTKFAELLRGLKRLGCPRILVLILGFLYRYVFVLTEEVMRMRLARECRRVGPAAARTELRLLGSMLGTLLLRSFERAERLFQAILSRGYAGEFPVYAPASFGWRDLAFLAGLSVVFVLTFAV